MVGVSILGRVGISLWATGLRTGEMVLEHCIVKTAPPGKAYGVGMEKITVSTNRAAQ